jgi:hypothetical protein
VNIRIAARLRGVPTAPPDPAADLPVGPGAATLLHQIADLTDDFEDVLAAIAPVAPHLAAQVRDAVERARLTLATYRDPAPYHARHANQAYSAPGAAW